MELTFLRPLYEHAGSFASVYLNTSGTGAGPEAHAVDVRWRDMRTEMARAGADAATLDALGEVVTGPARTALGAAAFGQGGTAPLAVRLPGPPLREAGHWARLPHLLPLLIQSPPRRPHLLVSATKAGGDVLAVRTADDVTKEHIEGTGWPVHKTRSGGSAQLEHQRAAEDAWETNAKELADAVVSAASGSVPEAIIVAGDVRARQLLVERLPKNLASKVIVIDRELPVGSDELAEAADQALSNLEDAECRRRLETYHDQLGAGGAVEGLAETVAAVQNGQVAELFLSGDYLADDPDTPGPALVRGTGLDRARAGRHRPVGAGSARPRGDRGGPGPDGRRAGAGGDRDRRLAVLMIAAGGNTLRDDIGALLHYPVPGT